MTSFGKTSEGPGPAVCRPERSPGGELSKVFTDAPSFHIIDQVFYHTDIDVPEMAPAWGMEAATRAFLKVIDGANRMTRKELVGAGLPVRRAGGGGD